MGGSSGGGSGGGSQTTVQKADPWSGQQPYLTRGFQEAAKLFLDSPAPQYYPNSTVTPYSPETNTALQLRTTRALMGSPIQNSANSELTKTLNGDYLYGGSAFNAALDSATRKIMPQIDSAFERSGRTGSGLAQTAKTQAISDAFADQYGNERENMMRGMMFAPTVAAQDYADIDQLANVGSAMDSMAGANLGDSIDRYNYGQNIRQQQLMNYMNAIQGNYGSNSTSTTTAKTPSQGLNIGGGISNALMGYGMAAAFPTMGLSPLLAGGLGFGGGLFS